MKAIFYVSFEAKDPTFTIGKQKDGHSCGICVINLLEHELFGTTLFIHSSRNILRIHYFTETAKFLLKEVRMHPFCGNELTLTSGIAICQGYLSTWPIWC